MQLAEDLTQRKKEVDLLCNYINDKDYFTNYNGFSLVKNLKYDPEVWVKDSSLTAFKFIRINNERLSVMHVDVDYPEPLSPDEPIEGFDPYLYERHLIPLPNAVVASDRGFHAFWFLSKALPWRATDRSMAFFKDVRTKLVCALNGDPSCAVSVAARSPFCKTAKVLRFTDRRFALDELNIPLKMPVRQFLFLRGQFHAGNRNNCVYKYLCSVYHSNSKTHSLEELIAEALRFQNRFPDVAPLDRSELGQIAKSALKSRYGCSFDDILKNRGAMGFERIAWHELGQEEGLKETRRRQQAAGEFSAKANSRKALEKLERAVQELQAEGKPITIKGVGRASGVALNTVRKHWTELTGEIRDDT